MNTYLDEYRNALRRFADFQGRSTVREFWSFHLVNTVIGLLLVLLVPPIGVVYAIGILLPGSAVGVRRLHDQDRSGWWLLIAFIPFGVLFLLFWATEVGTTGRNDFGPDPMWPTGEQIQVGLSKPTSSRGPFLTPPSQTNDLVCSECDASVPEAAAFCHHCGLEFEDLLCPVCGTEPSEDAVFCDQCGHNLHEADEPTDSTPVPANSCQYCGNLLSGYDPYCPKCLRTSVQP